MQRTLQRLTKGLVNLLISYDEVVIRLKKKMAPYKLFFKKSVQKDFDIIPKKDLKKPNLNHPSANFREFRAISCLTLFSEQAA